MANGILIKGDIQESVSQRVNVSCTANAWAKVYTYTAPVSGFYALYGKAIWSASFPVGASITTHSTAPTGYDDIAVSASGINEVSAVVYLTAGTNICFYGMWQNDGTNAFDVNIKLIP